MAAAGRQRRDEPKHTQKSEKKAEKNDDEEEKYTTKRCLAQMVFVVLALYLLHERNRAPSCGGAGCVRLTASSSNEQNKKRKFTKCCPARCCL